MTGLLQQQQQSLFALDTNNNLKNVNNKENSSKFCMKDKILLEKKVRAGKLSKLVGYRPDYEIDVITTVTTLSSLSSLCVILAKNRGRETTTTKKYESIKRSVRSLSYRGWV